MNTHWASALTQAVQEVFEGLCFILPSSSAPSELGREAEEARLETALVTVVVEFSGSAQGALWLSLPEPMLAPISEAMLGEDDVGEETVHREAVRELANIVCGNVLPLIAGKQAVFDLMSPRVLATGEPLPEPQARASLAFEQGDVELGLCLRTELPQGSPAVSS